MVKMVGLSVKEIKMKNMYTVMALVVTAALVTGCASIKNLEGPIPSKAVITGVQSGQPFVVVSKQGFMPAGKVYRSSWPDSNETRAGTRGLPADLVVPIVGDLISAAAGVGKDYYKTQQSMYSYRTDVGVFGVTNLDKDTMHEILSNGTRPNVDADRSAYRSANETGEPATNVEEAEETPVVTEETPVDLETDPSEPKAKVKAVVDQSGLVKKLQAKIKKQNAEIVSLKKQLEPKELK